MYVIHLNGTQKTEQINEGDMIYYDQFSILLVPKKCHDKSYIHNSALKTKI